MPVWRPTRTIALCALLGAIALNAAACAGRYKSRLAVAPSADNVASSAPSLAEHQPPAAAPVKAAAVRPARPSQNVTRPKPLPRPTGGGAIGTTGEELVAPQLPAQGAVTVTNTPPPPPADVPSHSLTTIIIRTLRRPASVLSIGAGFAASAFGSVVLYRRRRRITG